MDLLKAIILAIVEGITEFLPVSSTGHMILTSALMGIEHDAFTKVFEVSIQFGAILSVVVVYFKRFFKDLNFTLNYCSHLYQLQCWVCFWAISLILYSKMYM